MDIARTLTAAVAKDDNWYVARCLEVEVASQGETVDEALANLREALELNRPGFGAASFFEKDVDHARKEVPGRAA